LIVDDGDRAALTKFGYQIFSDWKHDFTGYFQSSHKDPLLQIADFLAFAINRSTHLSLKSDRTETDIWFLNLVGRMRVDCDELMMVVTNSKFSKTDFDNWYNRDRKQKGLE